MNRRDEYQVRVTRHRGWWYIEVPVLSICSECQFLSEAEPIARHAIATNLDVDASSFDVAIELQQALDERQRQSR